MMKKQNIIKSLLSLILSVSMLVTGLGLTVHASAGEDLGEQIEAGVYSETAASTEGQPLDEQAGVVEDPDAGQTEDKGLEGPKMFAPMYGLFSIGDPELNAKVEVDGVGESGVIDGSSEIKVNVSFDVPVMGDGGEGPFFKYGDVVELLLSEHFKFEPIPQPELKLLDTVFNKPLGTVTFSNKDGHAIATIVFDGDKDIFDPDLVGGPPYKSVKGQFSASLKYNGSHDLDNEGNKTVTILEKTYTLQLPEDVITYVVNKSGKEDLSKGEIEWTVTLNATKGTEVIDLKGYVFEDNLAGVGEYVTGSFKVNNTAPTSDLVEPDATANPPTTKLTYTFPENSTDTQTITFKTKISENTLANGGKITNRAGLNLNNKEVSFGSGSVTISKPSVTKSGEAADGFDSTTGVYDPTNRTITWYIEVDNKGRTLNNLVITDKLKDGLELQKATWQNKNGDEWNDVSEKTWGEEPADGIYEIGKINSIGRLEIVAKVPNDTDGSVIKKTYNNQASISWDIDGAAGSATSNNSGIGIGYNALEKSGTQIGDDVANHRITWTINVDLKNQDAKDFVVYDLFVHDKNTPNTDLTAATNWPAGILIGSSGVTRNNGQKYIESVVSETDSHLTVNPIKLYENDKHIATLVEITGLQAAGSNKVVLKSQVLDPDIIAGNNKDQTVDNIADLYKGINYRGSDTASVKYNNNILAKELLKREEVGNDYGEGISIDPNNRTSNAAEGFHYGYKEVIFRLNVNAAGVDFANVETNLTGGFGKVIVTDTLPAGWEFAKFSGGEDYLIYSSDGTLHTEGMLPSTGSLEANGSPLTTVSGLSASVGDIADGHKIATFTFTNLSQPYVILLKAKPTDSTFADYLTGADTHTETNTLSLHTANWEPGKSVTQDVTVDSKVLNKTIDLKNASNGILTWSVDYTPYGMGIGTAIEDTLPEGIDLRTDSTGQLIWEQDGERNINVYKLMLKDDGSGGYEEDEELSLNKLQDAISYDNNERKLTFTFPEEKQAYRLTYVTDITGMPGIVSNKVKLLGPDGDGTGTGEDFEITAQQGAATMERSGYLIVKKTNSADAPLPGAEFTLYNTNEDGTKGSARGKRITDDNGLAKFYGLTPGRYILVETKAPGSFNASTFEYDVVVDTDLTTTVNGFHTVGNQNPFVVVNYSNDDKIGKLTITKTVAGNAGDTKKKFDFTITLRGNVDGDEFDLVSPYTYLVNGSPAGTISSGDTISLAHGESITIIGLPAGATYSVTEEDYSADGYYTVRTGDAGVIEADQTKSTVFTNIRNVFYPGNLTITKTVTGPGADTKKAFDFVVTFNGATGSYNYTGVGVASGTIKSGDTISLAHGQSITITGLPEGSTYQVKEVEASAEGYTVTAVGAEGRILPNADAVAAFTNEHTISKIDVTGKKIWVGGPAKKPTIQLQLYRNGVKFGAAVSLKNGTGSYTWTGLAQTDANGKAYKYTVDEVAVAENYKKSVSADGLTVTNTYVDPDSKEDTGSQIPVEPDDESKPDIPHTGEGRSTSVLGLALIVAGLVLGLFAWQPRRPRKRFSGQE